MTTQAAVGAAAPGTVGNVDAIRAEIATYRRELPRLLAEGRAHLAAAGVRNARLQPGDGARGWGAETYDAIVLTGSTPMLPDSWLKQLKPNGRLFAVVGDSPAMTARLTRWTAPGAIVHEDLFETVIAPLKNAPQPARFVF